MTSRRGRARTKVALLASVALLAGCMTTHTLGRIDDPSTRAQLNALAAEGVDYVHLRSEAPTNRPPFSYRFSGIDPAGLAVEPARGQSLVVPLSQVESVTRYDHWRGARNGALGGGIVGVVTSFLLLALLQNLGTRCSDGCDQPDQGSGVRAVAIFGLAGVVIGGALGGAVGYEDRFTVAPPQ